MGEEKSRVDGRTTDTRDRILDVALELFVERGVGATRLQDIADRLGVTKTALYHHFGSKDDLVRTVLAPMAEDVETFLVDTAGTDLEPRVLLGRYFDLIWRHRAVCTALARDPGAISTVVSDGWVSFWTRWVQDLLAGPDADDEARVRAMVAVAGLGRAFLVDGVPEDRLRELAVKVALATLDSDG